MQLQVCRDLTQEMLRSLVFNSSRLKFECTEGACSSSHLHRFENSGSLKFPRPVFCPAHSLMGIKEETSSCLKSMTAKSQTVINQL